MDCDVPKSSNMNLECIIITSAVRLVYTRILGVAFSAASFARSCSMKLA